MGILAGWTKGHNSSTGHMGSTGLCSPYRWAAVYQLRVNVPASWDGKVIQLQFDAISYQVEVEVNGIAVGSHTGLWTPFAFDITEAVRMGVTNHIRLTVYEPGESFPMRELLAGFLPDVCLPFGGIWQDVRLVAFPVGCDQRLIRTERPQFGHGQVKAKQQKPRI